MKTAIFALFLLVCIPLVASAGPDKPDATSVDIATFRCFQQKQWDSVIYLGKQALREKIDFYYLRVRLGVAYFEKMQYYPAVTHLKKAHQQYPADDYVKSYLYYALKYTSQYEEASMILALFSPETRRSMNETDKFVENVHFQAGMTISSANHPDNLATLSEKDSIYGEQDLYGNNSFTTAGLNFKVSHRFRFSFDYTYLGFQKTKYIQYGRFEDHLTGITDTTWGRIYNFEFPWVMHDTSFAYTVRQHEINLGATISPGAGFRIMPTVHLIRVAYPVIQTTYRFDTVSDPSYYTSFDSTLYTFPFARLNYTFTQKDTSFTNWVASVKVTKDLGILNFGLAASISNLNGYRQKQIGLSFTYFPLGNLNLYGTTVGTAFLQGKDKRLLLGQVIGTKITNWMWAEGNIQYGDFTNANILNGAIVFNNSDRMKYRAGGTLVILAGKKLQFSLIYQFAQKESTQYYYIKNQDNTGKVEEVQQVNYNLYQTHSIIGGIIWKP